ncbi:MAG: DUF4296 domain-containing protein [Bacteroidales bacterium]|nr:DUF4296 domain-containing protein [Bacteroidales bacterium]MBP5374327.1 DUF4296 domain-containing protein [Bacteroidales bacterium]
MKKFLLLLSIVLLMAVSCKGPRRIPREKLEEIMYDMFLADQQIRQNNSLRTQADTSLVYEGIFERYGYDTDDFLYSLEYYLFDPDRMQKVLETVNEKFRDQAVEVKKQMDYERWFNGLMDIYHRPFSTKLPKLPPMPVDSLKMSLDSSGSMFFKYKEIPPDSLQLALDSLVVPMDTLLR